MKHQPSILTIYLLLATATLHAQENLLPECWFSTRQSIAQYYDYFRPMNALRARVERNGLVGLVDINGKEVCAPKYEDISWGGDFLYAVKMKGLYGAINRDGDLVLPCQYQSVKTQPSARGCAVLRDGLWAVLDTLGRDMFSFGFYTAPEFERGAIIGSLDGLHYGAWDWQGTALIPVQYHQLKPLDFGYWEAELFGKHGLLDSNGQAVSNFEFQQCTPLPGGAFVGQKSEQDYVVFDTAGAVFCKSSMAIVDAIGKGWYSLATKNKSWLISPRGAFIPNTTRYTVRNCANCPEGIFVLEDVPYESEGTFGWLDISMGNMVEPVFYELFFRKDTVYAFGQEKSGKYSLKGALLEKFPYSFLQEYGGQGHVIFSQSSHLGLIDSNLTVVLPPIYDMISPEEGGFRLMIGERVGFCGRDGQEIIPVQYDQIEIREGFTCFIVKSRGLFGVMDFYGKTLISLEYEGLIGVAYGSFIAKKQGNFGLISRQGKVLLPFIYEDIQEGYRYGAYPLKLKKDGKFSLANAKGQLASPAQNESINTHPFSANTRSGNGIHDFFSAGLKFLSKNGKQGLSDIQGNEVWPPVYDRIFPLFYSSSIAAAVSDGQVMLLDTSGQPRFSFRADTLLESPQGRFIGFLRDGKEMVLDIETLLERPMDGATGFFYHPDFDMILGRTKGGSFNMYDHSLRRIHPDMALTQSEYRYAIYYNVIREGKKGIIDRYGKILLEPEFPVGVSLDVRQHIFDREWSGSGAVEHADRTAFVSYWKPKKSTVFWTALAIGCCALNSVRLHPLETFSWFRNSTSMVFAIEMAQQYCPSNQETLPRRMTAHHIFLFGKMASSSILTAITAG